MLSLLLGSLLDPSRSQKHDLAHSQYGNSFDALRDLMAQALARETTGTAPRNDDAWNVALNARGLLDAARLLEARYHLVVTNVPYLARGKQHDTLKNYCAAHYPDANNDLANVFLERCLELSHAGGQGVVQIVMPQNWLFLTSYKKQRESLLKRVQWNLLARLGEGGFDSPQAAGTFIILLTQTRAPAAADFQLRGVDASAPRGGVEKAVLLREGEVLSVGQAGQLGNPDARVLLEESVAQIQLSNYAFTAQGISTTDGSRFVQQYWERANFNGGWEFFQAASTEQTRGLVSGYNYVIRWGARQRLLQLHRRTKESWSNWGSLASWPKCLGTKWVRNHRNAE